MCQSERTASSVVWRKGIAELRAGRKYEITQKGQILQLTIKNLEKSDSDTYSCDIGDAQSRAKLTVQGRNERNVVVHPVCAVAELDLSRAAEPLVSGSVSLMMAGTCAHKYSNVELDLQSKLQQLHLEYLGCGLNPPKAHVGGEVGVPV